MNKIYQNSLPPSKTPDKGRFGAPLRGGFTLIELLIVVLIIGILSAVALPQYERAVLKARLANLMVTTKAFKDAQERYYLANGTYAYSWEGVDIAFPAGSVVSGGDITLPDGTWMRLSSGMYGIYAWDKSRTIGYHVRMDLWQWDKSPDCMALGTDGKPNANAEAVCKSMGGRSGGGGSCASSDLCPPGLGGFGYEGSGYYQMYTLPQ